MRILHAPENIGGMAGVLAKAQSNLGHEAYSYSFASNHFKFPADYVLNKSNSVSERIKYAISFGLKFDIFHFYFGSSLMGSNLTDIKWLYYLGKKVFFYFCGCDLRDEKQTIMKYNISACANCFPKLCSPNRQLAKEVAEKYGTVNFVSTPDLLEFIDRSVLLPQAVDFDIIETILSCHTDDKRSDKFVIAHAPTNRLIKGTQIILDTVEHLKGKGYDIELMLIENLSHSEALKKYKQADIAIDQLLVGSYGLLSAELMALGVPTITYIREDLIDRYPEKPPLINACADTLEKTIMDVYHNRDKLELLREQGQQYAYNYHHPVRLALKCLEYYKG